MRFSWCKMPCDMEIRILCLFYLHASNDHWNIIFIPSWQPNFSGWISIKRLPWSVYGELHVMSSTLSRCFNQGHILIQHREQLHSRRFSLRDNSFTGRWNRSGNVNRLFSFIRNFLSAESRTMAISGIYVISFFANSMDWMLGMYDAKSGKYRNLPILMQIHSKFRGSSAALNTPL